MSIAHGGLGKKKVIKQSNFSNVFVVFGFFVNVIAFPVKSSLAKFFVHKFSLEFIGLDPLYKTKWKYQ